MANNYYDATGVLVLDKVTPVITALFGGFKLDASYPGNGEVYIAKISEDNDPTWDDVRESLADLARELGLPPADLEDTTAGRLQMLTAHFGADEDQVLCNLIDQEDSADLADLYRIALTLDDGHGLKAIKVEGCWHCSKPRLFEFGGHGDYFGRHCNISGNSSNVLLLGNDIDIALESGDLDKGADRILRETEQLLSGVTNADVRATLRTKLSERLVAAPDAAMSKLKWYAVTGRLPGDDEDTLCVFNVATRQEALKAFEDAMYENEVDPEATRKSVSAQHGQYVFVNSIVSSDSPIADIG